MDSHKQEQALDLIRLNPGRPKRDYLKCNHRMTKRLIHFISNFIKIVQKVLSPSAWSAYREHMGEFHYYCTCPVRNGQFLDFAVRMLFDVEKLPNDVKF